MRAWLTLALLGAVVAALGAWVHFKPPAREADTHALSTLKPADVKRVRVERFDAGRPAPAIVLERQSAGWRMVAPFAARVDETQIERLLGILDARAAARYPAVDLDRYGLGQPLAKVTIESQVIAYGGLNALTREQYFLVNDAVYAVPVVRSGTLPRGPEALLARGLFATGEVPVRFQLPAFTVTLEDGAWKVAPASEASADERSAWVAAWRQATALRVTPHDGGVPQEKVEIALKDGRTLQLGILQREPDVVLLRADEGVRFHFFAESGERLLSPPGAVKREKSR